MLLSFQKGQRMIKHRISLLILFVFHRIMERWNQTGQKYAGAPDIAHEFRGRIALLLWVLTLSTYATVAARIAYHLLRDLKVASVISSTIAIGLCVPAMIFKLAFTASDAPELLAWLGQYPAAALQEIPLISAARVTFLSIALAASSVPVIQIYFAHEDLKKRPLLPYLHDLLTLLLITQTRAHNIPLYLFFILQHNSLRRAELSSAQATLSTILFGHVSFFALGNSNAISSIDLSNGYNGVSSYNVAAVGLLVFISNWAGPIWWSVAGIKLLAERSRNQDSNHSKSNGDAIATRTRSRRPWVSKEHEHLSKSASARPKPESRAESRTSPLFTYIALWTLFTSGSLLAVMLSCTLLRTHLFIWTVFSPKYLYSMAWTLGFQLLIVIALSTALWKIAVQ
jgi:ethanolaminephosphotransferase